MKSIKQSNLVYNEKIKDKVIEDEDYRDILEGIIEVICHSNDNKEIQDTLVYILTPFITNLVELRNINETNKVNYQTNF